MLDIGAEGLVIARVESAEQAAEAVSYTRYAHSTRTASGTRGMCPGCHAARYSLRQWGDFVDHTERNVLVIPLIETQRGVDHVEEIVAVEGIDYVHFGPGDYSAEHGVPMSHPMVAEAWRTVQRAARAADTRTVVIARTPGLQPGDSEVIIDGMDLVGTAEYFTDKLEATRQRFASLSALSG
jgi:2-keto-3-deoxy-L-rhamnonate aldolase RhmA